MPDIGDIRTQPALGRTLRRIARHGREAFYTGEAADEMVSILRGLGGAHSTDDFAAHSSDYVCSRSRRNTMITTWSSVRRTGRAWPR
ncbi:gamma-glutamyltransferase [Bradyrhizobium sp. CER78]|nr:gamma-glutamyltransferase [Bradyrhizobium sp. CER78]MDH2379967.1 gamma-glutamyltransferase [Bradyrhizobium sp. CER78]